MNNLKDAPGDAGSAVAMPTSDDKDESHVPAYDLDWSVRIAFAKKAREEGKKAREGKQ